MAHPFEVTNRYHSQGLAAGGSALLDAVNKGKVHLAKFILDAGEYDVVNTRDFNGKTPLIRACYIKDEKTRDKTFELLVSKGANVNDQDSEGRTALSYACEMQCHGLVRILVRSNVDPDIPDIKGNTPLIYSSAVGNDIAIETLIRSFRRLGLDINHLNFERQTALLIAARNGFLRCATLLATDGRADVTVRDPKTGRTAEQWARERGCTDQEILPFAVLSEQAPEQLQKLQRKMRFGSIFNRSSALKHLGNGGHRTDHTNNGGCEAETSAASGDDVLPQLPVVGTSRPTSSEAAAAGWRTGAGNGYGYGLVRRKRYSLPCIRLHSSLDSPGACFSGVKTAAPSEQASDEQTVVASLADGSSSIGNDHSSTDPTLLPAPLSSNLSRAHEVLSARRSRELTRADTEVYPPWSLEDESG